MTITICYLLLIISSLQIIVSSQTVPANFFPFGTSTSDLLMPIGDDIYECLPISTNFPFFNKTFSSLCVNINGLISFNRGIPEYVPIPFPVGNVTGVAPFWADVDTRRGGSIYYRQVVNSDQLARLDSEILRGFPTFFNYKSTWAFVTTWYQVAAYNGNNAIHDTFQAVISTNGKFSFTIFNFGKLMWSNASTQGDKHAQSGFNAGDLVNYYKLPGSFTPAVRDLSIMSNVNVEGKWMFRIDASEITEAKCETDGVFTIVPSTIYFTGVNDLKFKGPCFNITDNITLTYENKKEVTCKVINPETCKCNSVYIDRIGRTQLKLTINSKYIFVGYVNSKNVDSAKQINGIDYYYANENFKETIITWTDTYKNNATTYAVYVITIDSLNETDIYLLQDNIKTTSAIFDLSTVFSNFLVLHTGHNKNVIRCFINIVKNTIENNVTYRNSIELQTLDLAFLFEKKLQRGPLEAAATALCRKWHAGEPDPIPIMNRLPPCWRTLTLSGGVFPIIFGDFVEDPTCNPKNPKSCENFHNGAKACYKSKTLFNKAGQQCCYSENNRLLVGPTGGGNLDMISSDSSILGHYISDIYSFYICCKLSNNCPLYYEKRPSDNGSRWQPPVPAGGSGDPHFVTLDQLSYTFNGFGEYILLLIEEIHFMIQVRLQPYKVNNVPGTVFKAVAIKGDENQDAIQVELNEFNKVNLFVSGVLQDYLVNTSLELNGCYIYFGDNEFYIQYANAINLEVRLTEENDALSILTIVDSKYKSKTKGLLGVMDGDKTNDFTLIDGTIVDIDATNDTEVFYKFGQNWMTSVNTTIFTYTDGYKHSDYNDKSFVPQFLSNGIVFKNKTLQELAEAECNGNKECLFDVSVTGKLTIGKQNLEFNEIIENVIESITEVEKSCVPQSTVFGNGIITSFEMENVQYAYEYQCDTDFCLVGQPIIKCVDGEYDYDVPYCISCKDITESITTSSQTYSTVFPQTHSTVSPQPGGTASSMSKSSLLLSILFLINIYLNYI